MNDPASKGSRADKRTLMATGPAAPPAAASNPAIPRPPAAGKKPPSLTSKTIVRDSSASLVRPTVPDPPPPTRDPVKVSRSDDLANTPTLHSAATQRLQDDERPVPPDSRARRESQPGSHLKGPEQLVHAGSESHRLRLQAGKAVPGTRYRLTRWLGEGGMGVVYEAEHMDIERRVALKILRFDLSQQAHMAQVFRDEARAASKVGSKYIVEIFDFGELPDGRLWFCMEMLQGHDLVPDDETQTTDVSRLIGLMRMTAKGLHQAHSQGIVHRDIKPENILAVREESGRDTIKIVDFGISALLAAGQQGASIAGTPHYMPPEQVLGQAFDGRCDMYAMGCMAYELLTGRPPFLADDLDTLLDMQVNHEPPPVESVRSDIQIPPQLAAVIMKCLSKHPDDRYRDMADLEAALCEAQIAAGLTTEWDDLPLPEVEPERRDYLLANMPSPTSFAQEKRPAWMIPAVGVGSALAAGLLAFLAFGGGPTEDELKPIEQLTTEARTAGSRMNYVFPPIDDREGHTSYRKVLELEAQEGNLDKPGDERGEELRSEFSNTLTEMGNKFWENDATKFIARDYYWQAAMFNDANAVAFERSGMTPGLLAQYRDKAASGDFTDAEIRMAGQVGYLAQREAGAEANPEMEAMLFAGDDVGAIANSSAMRKAMRSKGIKVPKSAAKSDEPNLPPPPTEDVNPTGAEGGEGGAAEGDAGEDPNALVLEEVASDRPSLGSSRGRKKKKLGGSSGDAGLGKGKKDPKKASELASQGVTALRAGRRSEAMSLFNQAIGYDRSNAKALMGLSDVYFDTGKSQKAVLYAERAVKAAKSNASYRLKLGDAYYKVLRYRDALEQYEKAKSLGSSRADSRISKVKGKIGG
jgi:tetratricopeptide (TPR) repeat protein